MIGTYTPRWPLASSLMWLVAPIAHERNKNEIKWRGFRPPLCTYWLNWARRTSWGWWYEWDDTALQTQDSKFEPLRSATEHATSLSRRLHHNIESLRVSGEQTFGFLETWMPERGSNPRSPTFQAGSFNHCTRAPALTGIEIYVVWKLIKISWFFEQKVLFQVAMIAYVITYG